MTVTRQRQSEFPAAPEAVIQAIHTVLARGNSAYRYENPVFQRETGSFTTLIKPNLWPLILSTNLAITVTPGAAVTAVRVETRSQAFLLGDRFHYYDRYLANFLTALAELLRPAA